jgi:hypothetical protein
MKLCWVGMLVVLLVVVGSRGVIIVFYRSAVSIPSFSMLSLCCAEAGLRFSHRSREAHSSDRGRRSVRIAELQIMRERGFRSILVCH